MPVKTCPKCSRECGPRTLTCECGHKFKQGKQKVKKATGNHPPLPPGRKLSIGEVQQYIAHEGMGDALFIILPNRISDPELSKLWDQARKAVSAARRKAYSISRGGDTLYGED